MIPKVGEKYGFFDDGKIRPSRYFEATVVKVVPKWRANPIMKHKWRKEKKEASWLYAKDTKVFVYCSIPEYDDHLVVFVSTRDGGWFSIDYPVPWMSGRLDVDGKATETYKRIYEGVDLL